MNWAKIRRFLGFERVVFADLDGTIITTKSGETFPIDCNDWELKEGIAVSLRNYRPSHLFIVSNQGGMEYGYFSEEEWLEKMRSIVTLLEVYLPDTVIDYSWCPTNDKKDPMRKPNTGMLEGFHHETGFRKRNALMIGDASGLNGQFSDSDYKCARRFGIRYIDVDYFIKWGNPCSKCEFSNRNCMIYRRDKHPIPCNGGVSIDFWITKFNYDKARQV